jgi:hypothetical protein
MDEFQDELIFRVDFSNVRGDLVKGVLPHASHPRVPAEGERVLLHDYEGNQCAAVVDGRRGPVVFFHLDETTWSAGEDVQATGIANSGRAMAFSGT